MNPDTLRAVLAAPLDNGPRRACADALEAAGDVRRARFVRVQLEASANRPDNPIRLDRHKQLLAEADELLAGNREAWAGAPIVELCQDWTFGRGLVEEIVLPARAFADHHAALAAAAPISKVRWTGVADVPNGKRFHEGCARLYALDLSGTGLRDEDLLELCVSPHVTGLAWLGLRDNPITQKGIAEIAASRSLANLQVLDMTGHPDDPAPRPTVSKTGAIWSWTLPPHTQGLMARYGERPWMRGFARHTAFHPPHWTHLCDIGSDDPGLRTLSPERVAARAGSGPFFVALGHVTTGPRNLVRTGVFALSEDGNIELRVDARVDEARLPELKALLRDPVLGDWDAGAQTTWSRAFTPSRGRAASFRSWTPEGPLVTRHGDTLTWRGGSCPAGDVSALTLRVAPDGSWFELGAVRKGKTMPLIRESNPDAGRPDFGKWDLDQAVSSLKHLGSVLAECLGVPLRGP